MVLVEVDQRTDIDIADAVAVREQEGVVGLDIALDALHARPGHRVKAGFRKRDAPVVYVARLQTFDLRFLAERHRDIRRAEPVVQEKVLDDMALMTEAQDEVLDPEVRVTAHDVPKDWIAADGNHRLRNIGRDIANAR